MPATSLTRIAMVVVLAAWAGPTPSSAQPTPGRAHVRYPRPRIVVTPRRPAYSRRCTSWLELQHRPSGTVLYPQYSCWWEQP